MSFGDAAVANHQPLEDAVLQYLRDSSGYVELEILIRNVTRRQECSRSEVERAIRRLVDLGKIKFGSQFDVSSTSNFAA